MSENLENILGMDSMVEIAIDFRDYEEIRSDLKKKENFEILIFSWFFQANVLLFA